MILQACIKVRDTAKLVAGRLDPNGLIADEIALFKGGCEISIDPIRVAAAAAYSVDSYPIFDTFQVRPHAREEYFGHIWMTDSIMWTTDQLLAAGPSDSNRLTITICQVGLRFYC
ncbi:hypothetical protein GCM10009504_38470 [Pseudomonas laurentiana]|nr:hypothetical protein GCM10009504_38470 [Pseudomonas laurentiana]